MSSNFKELLLKKMINEKFGTKQKQIPVIEIEEKIYIPLEIYPRPILKAKGKGIYFEYGLVEIEGKIYRQFIKAEIKEKETKTDIKTIIVDEFTYIDTDSIRNDPE